MKAASVWNLAFASSFLIVVAGSYVAFVAIPSSLAQGDWATQQESLLPVSCASSTIQPMVAGAQKVVGSGFGLFCLLGILVSMYLYWLAGHGRGLDFRRW
jgi:hypothetical protein